MKERRAGSLRGSKMLSVLTATVLASSCDAAPERDTQINGTQNGATTSLCSPDGIPRTYKQMLCDERRVGRLEVVVVPGLSPAPQDSEPVSVPEAAAYAANVLREITDNTIRLTPHVTIAEPEVADAMIRRNAGFTGGDNCIDTNDKANQLTDIVKEQMPDTQKNTQTVIYGGKDCGSLAGTTMNLDPKRKFAEVYDIEHLPFAEPLPDDEKEEFLGSVMAHEILHNYLSDEAHADALYFEPQHNTAIERLRNDTSQPVNISKLLALAGDIASYGEDGNIMSADPHFLNNNASRNDLFNPVQQEFIEEHTNAANDSVKELTQDSPITIPYNSEAIRAVNIASPLGERFKRTISGLYFEPVRGAENNNAVKIYLDTSSPTTVYAGTFALPNEGSRLFIAPDAEINASKSSNTDEVTFSLQPIN